MATPSGGTPISPGILAQAKQTLGRWVTGFFGPEQPPPVNAPPGTPPRSLDYPVGFNINIQPRNAEPVSYAQMRALADSFDLIRLCIETRKDQLAKMKWQFAVKKEPDEKPGQFKARNAKNENIPFLTDFFQSPNKEHTWQEWIRLLMEDLLVIDAPVIVPISKADGTLWTSGEPYALEVIDGATISRKIDYNGRTPQPPGVAYQQIIKGLPACDFTRDQLVYKPRNLRTHKFFGFSPVEQIIMTINIGLRRQIHLLNYYTDGNVPEAIAMVPKEWSADQIKEFQDWFDSILSGNLAARRKVTFIPEAGTVQFTRDPKLKDELDEWLARIVCYAFSMSPQPFIHQMNRATAETSVEQAAAEGLTPTLVWLEDLINWLILPKYFGIKDIEFSFQADKDANPLEQSEIQDRALKNGSMTLDEVREANGQDPIENGAGKRNMIYTASGATPVDVLIENADNPPEPAPVTAGGFGAPQKPAPRQPKKVYRGYTQNGHSRN